MKILLLEDETMLRTTIKEFLEELNCDVIDYARGDEAALAIKSDVFDAVILDIDVPGIDGYGVLKSLREKDLDTPAIFITALLEIEDISKAYDLGCTDYLKKPFKLQELWIRINQALKFCKKDAGFITLGGLLQFDKKRKKLFMGTTELALTNKRAQILYLLVTNLGLSVEIERFRQFVWDRDDIDDATIRTEINRLRKIAPQLCIKNIKGIGYKLEPRVTL